jgi:hypothetical protein
MKQDAKMLVAVCGGYGCVYVYMYMYMYGMTGEEVEGKEGGGRSEA